jgi:hypothetical protein
MTKLFITHPLNTTHWDYPILIIAIVSRQIEVGSSNSWAKSKKYGENDARNLVTKTYAL